MKVIIDDTYHLQVDDKGHALYQKLSKLDKNGKEQFKFMGAFRTIDQALKRLARLKVLSRHDELVIDKYLRELKQAVSELTKAVQG